MWKVDAMERPWCWERLKAKEESGRKWDGLLTIPDSMDMNLGKLWEIVRDTDALSATVHGVANSCTRLGDWTTMVGKMAPQSYTHLHARNLWTHYIMWQKGSCKCNWCYGLWNREISSLIVSKAWACRCIHSQSFQKAIQTYWYLDFCISKHQEGNQLSHSVPWHLAART